MSFDCASHRFAQSPTCKQDTHRPSLQVDALTSIKQDKNIFQHILKLEIRQTITPRGATVILDETYWEYDTRRYDHE